MEYTIDAKINGTLSTGSGYPSYIPSDFPDGYEGIYNQTDTYIRSGRTVADLAGNWNVPSSLGGGSLTITAAGTGTLNQNDNDYGATIAFVDDLLLDDGMVLRIDVPNCEVMILGLVATPASTITSFTLKNASYQAGILEGSGSTLTFTKKN